MRCLACHKTKPDSAFESHRSRRCLECAAPTPCTICGALCPPNRQTCMSEACLEAARKRSIQLAAEASGRRAAERCAQRKTHRCSNCMKTFLLSSTQLRPIEWNPDGSVRRFHTYCRPCERAYKRVLCQMSLKVRERNRVYAREYRQQVKELIRRDPQFAAKERARRAEANRRYRERKSKEAASPDPRPMPRGGPELDALPFLEWLTKVAKRYETERDCWVALGVSERRVSDWRTGHAESVRFDVVDEACLNEGNTFIWEIYEQFSPFEEEELIAA